MSRTTLFLCLTAFLALGPVDGAEAQSIFLNLATDVDGTTEIDGNVWNQIPAADPPTGGAANFTENFVDEIFDTAGDLVRDVAVAVIGGYNTADQFGFGFGGEDTLDDVATSLFWGGPGTPEGFVEIQISGLQPGNYEVGVIAGLDNRTTDRIFDIQVNGNVIEEFDAQDAYDTGDFPVLDIVVEDNGRMIASTPGLVNGEHISGLMIFPMTSSDPCDFDGDGSLGMGDVDALSSEIQRGSNSTEFDLNNDQTVDTLDLEFFVTSPDKLNSWIGDSNLDGEFNSADFVAVFQAGLFETQQPATWGTGDWNSDGVFSSTDFVAAFQNGGFEQGPRAAQAAVPEPDNLAVALLIGLGVCTRFARTASRSRRR